MAMYFVEDLAEFSHNYVHRLYAYEKGLDDVDSFSTLHNLYLDQI
jgi:hypothetical protein